MEAQEKVVDRRSYWKRRYDDKKVAGICVRGACRSPAEPGVSLCGFHLDKQNKDNAAARRRKFLEERKRERPPEERSGVTLRFTMLVRYEDPETGKVSVEHLKCYLQTGEYDDGRLAEVFVKLGKPGANVALFDQWGIAASIALQYGAGVEELFSKHVGTRFEPSGRVVNSDGAPIAVSPDDPSGNYASVLDFVSRWIIKRYAHKKRRTP